MFPCPLSYIEEIGAVDYNRATSVDPAMVAGVDPTPQKTKPLTTEPAKPAIEPILAPQQSQASVAPTADKGISFTPFSSSPSPSPCPFKKKSPPPTKPKGIFISASAAPTALISEEEEELVLRGDDITHPLTSALVEGLSEEEQLALPSKPLWRRLLKASSSSGKLHFRQSSRYDNHGFLFHTTTFASFSLYSLYV